MADLVMILIALVVIALGVFLMYLTIANKGYVKYVRTSGRIKHGIISAVVIIVGVMFMIFNFTE